MRQRVVTLTPPVRPAGVAPQANFNLAVRLIAQAAAAAATRRRVTPHARTYLPQSRQLATTKSEA
jgi:hypothetical protein